MFRTAALIIVALVIVWLGLQVAQLLFSGPLMFVVGAGLIIGLMAYYGDDKTDDDPKLPGSTKE